MLHQVQHVLVVRGREVLKDVTVFRVQNAESLREMVSLCVCVCVCVCVLCVSKAACIAYMYEDLYNLLQSERAHTSY